MTTETGIPGSDGDADLEQRIDAIESGYEFLLAYAAQGRNTDRGAAPDRSVRTYLGRMEAGLDGLADAAGAAAPASPARQSALGQNHSGCASMYERSLLRQRSDKIRMRGSSVRIQ